MPPVRNGLGTFDSGCIVTPSSWPPGPVVGRFNRSGRPVNLGTLGYKPIPPMGTWAEQAACIGMDTNLFFPDKGDGRHEGSVTQVDVAKVVCARCPVRADCLDYAIRTHQKHGVWGGKTPKERRPLTRQWREEGRL